MAADTNSTETADDTRNRRNLVGVVTSDKMDKTVVVQVSRRVMAPKFAKYVTKRTKYKAHSETNEAKQGDTVRIVESRPLSKDKRWRVAEIVTKAKIA